MKKVLPIRREFPKIKDLTARKQMAKKSSMLGTAIWKQRAVLPKPDYHIDEKDLSLIREAFDRIKDRKTHAIKSEELVDFNHDFAKKFKFKVPLHPKNMQQMNNPHFGYLCNFHNRSFNINQCVQRPDRANL